MLSRDEIRAHLATLTYKPGWTMELHEDPWEGPYLRFVGPVDDSYNPGQSIDLGISTWLPPMLSTEQLDYFVQWRMWRVEGHEAREYLQRNGRPLFDPHKEEISAPQEQAEQS